MILAMIVIYCFILYLLFDVFKVVKSTTRNRIYVTLIGIFGIICVLFFINWYQPLRDVGRNWPMLKSISKTPLSEPPPMVFYLM